MEETNKEYLASLKSIETENYIDRKFYRPLGYRIADALKHTGVTPNTITIISIIFGIAGGVCFYYSNIWIGLLGIALLVSANILDCVDGQLSRMTGKHSKIGRILDGIAGDLWFITIYTALSLQLYHRFGYRWIFLIALLSLLSHFSQAAVTDYYKTLHLFFVNRKKSSEFETTESIESRLKVMSFGIKKFITTLYLYYTHMQSFITPKLQVMMKNIRRRFPDDNIPEPLCKGYREGSRIVMKLVDLMTFNGRSIPLFIAVLTGQVWFYFLYEIVFLNIVLLVAKNQHETLCEIFNDGVNNLIERGIIAPTSLDDLQDGTTHNDNNSRKRRHRHQYE